MSVSCTQSSPPSLCAEGRTSDLQSILSVISDAQQFVYIAVMNYLPTMEFSKSKRSVISVTLSPYLYMVYEAQQQKNPETMVG